MNKPLESDSTAIYHVAFPTKLFRSLLMMLALLVSALLLSGSLQLQPTKNTPSPAYPIKPDDPAMWLSNVRQQLQSTALVYPETARRNAIEGVCTVQFTVTETGEVKDVLIMKQCDNTVFERPVINALKRNTLPPRMVNGKPIEVVGVTNQFTFTLNKNAQQALHSH